MQLEEPLNPYRQNWVRVNQEYAIGYKVKLIGVLASMFKRDKDGQLLWFSGPPAHVTPTTQPVHSVAYLEWKRKQQQQQQN